MRGTGSLTRALSEARFFSREAGIMTASFCILFSAIGESNAVIQWFND